MQGSIPTQHIIDTIGIYIPKHGLTDEMLVKLAEEIKIGSKPSVLSVGKIEEVIEDNIGCAYGVEVIRDLATKIYNL